jgi:ribosomal RNA-processing protein 9
MPPKRASGLTSSKKRPHEAPTKGRKVFAGSRQKVQRGGGGGGSRGRGADDEGADDPEGDDDMMEDAMDDDDGDGRARRAEGRGRGREEEESEEEIEETADEKRLRLAKSYLDKLRAEEAEAGGDSDEDDEDEEDARNMDSHDRLANRLKNEAMHKSGRVRREIARRVVAPTFGDEDEASEDDDDDDRAGTVWRGHRLSVTGLALTADDATAYSVSKEGGIVRWDVETGARTKFPRAPPAVVDPTKGGGGPMAPPRCGAAALLCCAVAQERHLLCTAGADKRIHVWDTRSMKHVQELASHRGAVTSLAIRDGTGQLFSGSADRTLKVWSLDDMAYVDTLFGHQSEVMCVAPQRRERVVTVGRDRTCRFWKVAEDSQLIFRPAPGAGQLESCAFVTPDTWVTGSDDGTVSLWSTTKKRAVMSWEGVHGFGGGMSTNKPTDENEPRDDAENEKSAHGVVAPKFFEPREVSDAVARRVAAQEMCGVGSGSANAPAGVSNAGRWVNAVAVGKGTDLCASGAGDGAIRLWHLSDDPGRQLAPLGCLPARGFVNALAVASSGRFVLAGMGQEPRGGRWARDAHAKNGLLMHRLKLSAD